MIVDWRIKELKLSKLFIKLDMAICEDKEFALDCFFKLCLIGICLLLINVFYYSADCFNGRFINFACAVSSIESRTNILAFNISIPINSPFSSISAVIFGLSSTLFVSIPSEIYLLSTCCMDRYRFYRIFTDFVRNHH